MSGWDRLYWEYSTFLASLRLRRMGASVGEQCRFLGQPIVSLTEDSTLTIGARTVVVSHSTGTALGVRSQVIFRCLAPGAGIVIGNDTGLSGTVICSAMRVEIGKRCLIGADCMIFDTDFHHHAPDNRRYSPVQWDKISSPVSIGDDVFLGTRVIVCKGVTIGSGTIVAAGSVVTRDLPQNTICAGSPAVPVKKIQLPTGNSR